MRRQHDDQTQQLAAYSDNPTPTCSVRTSRKLETDNPGALHSYSYHRSPPGHPPVTTPPTDRPVHDQCSITRVQAETYTRRSLTSPVMIEAQPTTPREEPSTKLDLTTADWQFHQSWCSPNRGSALADPSKSDKTAGSGNLPGHRSSPSRKKARPTFSQWTICPTDAPGAHTHRPTESSRLAA